MYLLDQFREFLTSLKVFLRGVPLIIDDQEAEMSLEDIDLLMVLTVVRVHTIIDMAKVSNSYCLLTTFLYEPLNFK